jgi:Protein of unknown function (DUF2911)
MQKRASLIVLAVFLTTAAFSQQDKSKRPSPPAQADCKLADGKTVHIDYSSPRMRDPKTGEQRKIFGGLVPYGQVWRTGANEATTLVTTTDLTVGGTNVPAGTYTLFTLPTADQWTLIISKATGEWGIPYPGKDKDFARVGMQVVKRPSTMENFTISLDSKGASCNLRLDWETTEASVELAEKK